jgi:hypothetical protein
MEILIGVVFISGILCTLLVEYITKNINRKKEKKDIDNQFSQLLTNIKVDKVKFKNRVNNTVYLETKLNDYGDVNIIYFMDSGDIAIFKGSKCIFHPDTVDISMKNNITELIVRKYNKDINDVVEVLGFVFYRREFEKSFNIDLESDKNKPSESNFKEESDIDKILKKNNNKFDIDEILDKINKFGIEKLTDDEKNFLKKYKN